MGKKFNTTGLCIPERHYMVDISGRVAEIKRMAVDGEYFTINRPRQYGKTTMLNQLAHALRGEYAVIKTSFEGTGDSLFGSKRKAKATWSRSPWGRWRTRSRSGSVWMARIFSASLFELARIGADGRKPTAKSIITQRADKVGAISDGHRRF